MQRFIGVDVANAGDDGLVGSRFDLATGRAVSPPATQPVAVFSVWVDGGDVYIRLTPDRAAPAAHRRGAEAS